MIEIATVLTEEEVNILNGVSDRGIDCLMGVVQKKKDIILDAFEDVSIPAEEVNQYRGALRVCNQLLSLKADINKFLENNKKKEN